MRVTRTPIVQSRRKTLSYLITLINYMHHMSLVYVHVFLFHSIHNCHVIHLSLVVRKPVFRVSDQVRHKPVCAATEDGLRLQISDLGSRGIVLSVERKALISFVVTAKLICIFVFAYAKKPVLSRPGSFEHGDMFSHIHASLL